MTKIWVLFSCLLVSFTGLCQPNAVYPDLLSVYFFNMASINAGYVPSEGTADFALGYKFHEGQLKKVNSLSFAGSRIFRSRKGNAQVVRLLGYNEQSGPYISSPKGYMNYAYSARLGEETHLSAGLALGMAGIYYSAPTFSSSHWMPDGSLGADFRFRAFSMGVSALQVLNSQSSSLGDSYRLGRYYHVYSSLEKQLGIDWKCNGYAIWRKLNSTENDLGLALSFTVRDVFTLGSSIRNRAGISLFTAFHLLERENRLLLSLNYNVAPIFTSLPSWRNSFELSMGYTLE